MSQESVLRITIDSREAKRNAEALNRELVSIERNGDFATKSMDSMSSSARQLAGYMAGIVTVGAAINKMDAYTGISNKLKLVTESQEELNQAMQDTFAIAQKSASSWGAVNDVYSKYMSNAKTLNLTQEQTARLTEITSKAVAISGSTTESAAGALFQYGQALDGNILRAEEYNSLVDGAGGLLNAMAKGLGVTRGELRQMMLDGKLTGEVITKALLKAGESVDELYNKTDVTIGQSLTVLSNEVTKFTGETGKASGVASTLAGSIKYAATNFNELVSVATILGAYWIGTYIPSIYASTSATIKDTAAKITDTLATRAKAQADYEVAKSNLAATAAMVNAMGITNSQTAAMMTNARAAYQQAAATRASTLASGSLLSILGGPVGLGITVASVAAGYLLLKDSTKEVTSTLDIQKDSVSDLVEKYLELDELQRRTTLRELEKEVKKLSTAYTVAYSDLNAFIGWLEDSGSVSEKTAREMSSLFKQYNKGQLSASEFATAINGLSGVQDKHKEKIDNLTTANAKAKTEYEKVKASQKALTDQTANAIKANTDEAKSINEKRIAQEKLKALEKSYSQKNLDTDFALINIKSHGSEMGNALADFYDENKIEKTRKLTNEEWSVFQKYFSKKQELKKLEDDIAESKRKQNKESEKKYQYTKEELKMLQRVQSLMTQSGLDKYAESKGIPSYAVAGLLAQESGGIKGAKSDTGAIGYWQTTSAYRKQNNLSVADSYNLEKTGRVVIDNLAKAYAKTGNLAQAILSHNAGDGGASQFMKTGKVSGGARRNKEVAGYLPSIDKWSSYFAGGKKGSIANPDAKDQFEELQNFLEAKAKTEEEIASLQAKYNTEAINRSKERDNEINQATILGQQDLIPKIKERYAAQDEISRLQLDAELNSYKWTEDQKLQNTHDINIQRLTAEGQYSDKQKALVKQALDEQLAYELEAYKKLQEKKLIEFKVGLQNQTGELQRLAIEATAKNTMSSPRLATWQLQDDYSTSTGNAWDDYQNAQKEANTKGDNGQYVNDDKTRKEMLLEAERQYQSQLLAIKQKAAQDEAMLRQQQQAATLAGYGAMFGMVGSMLDAYGEKSSASYRIAFALQKAFVLSSALLNAKGAVMAAWNDPSNTTIWSKMAAAAATVIQTNDLMSAIQGVVLSGMAHDGIDSIPKEGTWLLDKGERVVDSRTNADLKGMIANQKNGGGDVHIQVNVTDSGVSAQSNQSDQKQLGQMIGNAVRAVIRQEQRQGGLLAK